jgi:nicotinate-nucleotide pyrophosphorylase (carboxylating)
VQDIIHTPEFRDLIRRALDEDVGSGDASSLAVVDAGDLCSGRIVSRGDYVVAGATVAAAVFTAVDSSVEFAVGSGDGSPVQADTVVATVSGPARAVLTGERTALNFLQRMSGIATLTRSYVMQTEGCEAVILDTRKTTPTLRMLEKYAVRCGGGENHRMGLYDRIMLKDNHLAQWRKRNEGTLAEMVIAARNAYPELEVEVEVESLNDFKLVVDTSPDWILLDNMSVELMAKCVSLCGGRSKLEASGGVSLDTVAAIAATGVDAISVGALTHSAVAADFSLEFDS